MKSFVAVRNWSLSPINFLISLPIILSKTIGLNNLEESYEALLGLGIMTIIDLSKWEGQNPKSIHVLAILMMMPKQLLSLRMILRWLHNNLSGPSLEELLQLAMALLNSSLENRAYEKRGLSVTSSRILMSTWQWRAVLKVKWSTFHKLSIVKHGWSLYLMVSIAGNLYLLTQLMSFQGHRFLLVISWILRSKKDHLKDLNIFLKIFQSLRVLINL